MDSWSDNEHLVCYLPDWGQLVEAEQYFNERLWIFAKLFGSSMKCPHCPVSFTRKDNLIRHIKKFHPFAAEKTSAQKRKRQEENDELAGPKKAKIGRDQQEKIWRRRRLHCLAFPLCLNTVTKVKHFQRWIRPLPDNSLRQSNISKEKYALCQKVWQEKGMRNLREFLEWYYSRGIPSFDGKKQTLYHVERTSWI